MKETIIITGASCEIGLETIKELENVYNLILIYNKNINPLKAYVDKHEVIHCDFEKEDEIIKLIKTIKEKNVNIFALINIAGLTKDMELEDINMEDFINSYKVNVYAPLKISIELKPKKIILLSSTDGIDTYNKYDIIYSLTKNSLFHLTKILNEYLEQSKTISLAPNYIDTKSVREMNPEFLKSEMKRINQKELIKPETIAKNIKKLIQNENKNTIYRMDDNNGFREIN